MVRVPPLPMVRVNTNHMYSHHPKYFCHSHTFFQKKLSLCIMRRRRPNVSFKESFIRGAIGKRFVIKHYKWYIIKTKFPDMTNIVPSAKQVECRNRFREAVAYAKAEMAHPVAKSQWLKRTRKKWRVFNYIIKTYMRMQAEIKKKQQTLTTKVSQAEG